MAVCAALSVILDFFSDILDVTAEVDFGSIVTIDEEEAEAEHHVSNGYWNFIKSGEYVATYIMLFGFTKQGIMNIKQSPARVEAARKTCQTTGAKVKDFYAVMGMDQYDTLFILEAPDDEAIAKAALTINSLGNASTKTHRAFTEAEYKRIITALP
jgi:uncharacterized protein with GYD domain